MIFDHLWIWDKAKIPKIKAKHKVVQNSLLKVHFWPFIKVEQWLIPYFSFWKSHLFMITGMYIRFALILSWLLIDCLALVCNPSFDIKSTDKGQKITEEKHLVLISSKKWSKFFSNSASSFKCNWNLELFKFITIDTWHFWYSTKFMLFMFSIFVTKQGQHLGGPNMVKQIYF